MELNKSKETIRSTDVSQLTTKSKWLRWIIFIVLIIAGLVIALIVKNVDEKEKSEALYGLTDTQNVTWISTEDTIG